MVPLVAPASFECLILLAPGPGTLRLLAWTSTAGPTCDFNKTRLSFVAKAEELERTLNPL